MTKMHYTPSDWVPESDDSLKGKIFDSTEAKALLAEVIERLSAGSESLIAREVTKDGLLTAIVTSLAWDYGANITGMYNDQWSAVTAEVHEGPSVWVECYDLLAGAAMAWKLIADNCKAEAR